MSNLLLKTANKVLKEKFLFTCKNSKVSNLLLKSAKKGPKGQKVVPTGGGREGRLFREVLRGLFCGVGRRGGGEERGSREGCFWEVVSGGLGEVFFWGGGRGRRRGSGEGEGRGGFREGCFCGSGRRGGERGGEGVLGGLGRGGG